MGSPLDYISSEGFRKKLITRNLVPYAKSPTKVTPPTTYEVIQSDYSVVDSPDGLIDTTFFADKQYTLNRWGNRGGYYQAPALSNNLNLVFPSFYIFWNCKIKSGSFRNLTFKPNFSSIKINNSFYNG